MANIVLAIFHFLAKRPVLRYSLLIFSSLLFVFLGSKVSFEEDITKLLPSSGSNNSESLAFSQLRVKDKIFVLLTSADANNPLSPDELVDASDDFVESVFARDSSGVMVADILSEVDQDMMLDLVGYLADNFPMFVDVDNYDLIDSLANNPASVSAQIANGRKALTSPAGMAIKDMIASDPIGLRNVVLAQMNEIRNGLGGTQIVYDGHLFSPDTTVALVYVSPSFKSYDSKSGNRLVEMLEEEMAKCELNHEGLKVHFHGAPVQSVNNSRQVKHDLSLTLAVSVLIVCVFIWLCFKNRSTIPVLILPVGYGAFFALAMMYVFKGSMSLMALGIGAIVLGVALSYCLHVITHYKYVSTPERVIEDQAKPVFLGCLTTIGSFLGLMCTNSELLKDFGLFASFALVGTTFFSLVFLPHFFNPEKNRKSQKAFGALERFNSHRFEKHKWLICAIAVISIVCLYSQRWVSFDSDLRNISYTADKVRVSTSLLASKTQPGFVTSYYAASDSVLDVALTKSRAILATLDSLKGQGLVAGFSKAALLFPTEDEQNERIDKWNEFWGNGQLEKTLALVDQGSRANDVNPAFFAPFADFVSADYDIVDPFADEVLPSGLLANIIEYTDSVYMVFTSVQLRESDKKTVGRALVDATGCVVVDPMFYTDEMVQSIKDDFDTALNISMIFVFVILLISFRSLLLSVVAFIPMTLSWYIVLGVMGIFDLQFNLINIVVSTFIFGIGVDYSIFVMEGLLSKSNPNADSQLLVYHKTAIFFSAVVLMVSTGSLLVASHPALKSIGLVTIIGMSSAVLLAYSLQPFLFHFLVSVLKKFGIKTKWMA